MSLDIIFDNIKTRRTCRSFKPDAVPDELLHKLVDVAKYAPSGHNQQGWHFSVIRTPRGKALVEQAAGEAPEQFQKIWSNANWPYQPGCECAPVIILISRRSDVPWPEVGPLLAAGNLILAANAVGLGAMWSTALSKDLFRSPDTAVLKTQFMPEDYELCAGILLGYPDNPPVPQTPRKKDVETWL